MVNKEYKMRYKELSELYEIAKKVSVIELGHTGKTFRSYLLEDIVEKLLLHVKSILIIFGENQKTNFKELDVSAIASLARNIIDCSNNYYYFGERNISNEELKLRFDISAFHDSNQIKKIYSKLDFRKGSLRWSVDETYFLSLKSDIKESKFYKSLTAEQKRQLSIGNRQKKEYTKKNILDDNIESACYNILSGSVHSFNGGLGNNSIKDIRIMYGNYFDTMKLLFLSFEISIIYVSNVIIDYLSLIKRLNKFMLSQEKKKIINLQKTTNLENWLKVLIEEYDYDPFALNKII